MKLFQKLAISVATLAVLATAAQSAAPARDDMAIDVVAKALAVSAKAASQIAFPDEAARENSLKQRFRAEMNNYILDGGSPLALEIRKGTKPAEDLGQLAARLAIAFKNTIGR